MARFANGQAVPGEVLVGADGIRSRVRALATPQYTGYVVWPGLVEGAVMRETGENMWSANPA